MSKTVLILLVITASSVIAAKKCDIKCTQAKSYGMRSADCYKLDLTEVPQCLRDDIQVLDLSMNRLRVLKSDSFSKYTGLKYLYLHDNLIMQIEENAFSDLNKLEVLDLRLNGIQTMPPVIFHLPSLKKLYLGKNMNINIAEIIDNATPITAPLEYLDLSFNQMHELPNLGVLPQIFAYNISGNDLYNVAPKDFAGLCKLGYLYNDNMTTEFEDPCDCWRLKLWFKEKNVTLSANFTCKYAQHETECSTATILTEDREMYGQCVHIQQSITLTKSFINYGLPILAGIAVICITVIYCYFKRRRRLKRKTAMQNGSAIRNVEPLVQNTYS